MNVRPPRRRCARIRCADRGFTLIELMFALVLSGMIAGVVAAAMITSLNVASSTSAQVSDSNDAGLISAFLLRDAQSSGATDPTTARSDTTFGTLGVTTDIAATPFTGCAQPAKFVLRFSWIDPIDRTTLVVVYYVLDSTKAQLSRSVCKSGTTISVTVGSHLLSAVAVCDTACTGTPKSVSLSLVGTGTRAPFSYSLMASLRRDIPVIPTMTNSIPVALLTLGPTASCPNLDISGKTTGAGIVSVVGNALIDGSCGSSPINGDQTLLKPTGTTSSMSPIGDPYKGSSPRVPPTFTCSGGSNPATIGLNASGDRNTVIAYPQKVSITTGSVVFQPGRYVFCNGLEMIGGQVSGTDVLWYVNSGTLLVNAAATVDLTGRTSGAEASLLMWVAASNQTIRIDGGLHVSSLRGVIYAPTSTLQLSSVLAANIGGVIVKDMKITGAGAARIGLPLPVLSVSPATIPRGQVNINYNATLTAAGATAPSSWSATGLPAGLSISAAGVISGTPLVPGTFAVTATVFDATAEAASFDYTVTINPVFAVLWPASLSNGDVGVAYTATSGVASDGTTPYTWAVTGMPTGLSFDTTNGAFSGTPTSAGTYGVVTVTVTDSATATATKTYSVTIGGALVITGPASLPIGQSGVAYTPTQMAFSGGTNPITWSQSGLPAGMSIDTASGVVSGTPTVSGPSIGVTIKATDAFTSATKAYTLTINSALNAVWPTLPGGQVGTSYTTTTMSASGGTTPYTWTAPSLPAGLSIGSASGTVYGTPTSAGTFTFNVTVTDAMGASLTNRYTVTMAASVGGCPGTINGWKGEYFNNQTLTAPVVLCRDDASINFDWGNGGPDPTLPVDNFSARWTRTQTFTAGNYTFTMGSDDGSRLFIDGVNVLNNWVDQGYPGSPPTVAVALTAGNHTIVMEYYENSGGAKATLAWVGSAPPVSSCPTAPVGWLGQYYNNIGLTGQPTVCRDDANINFNWSQGSPDPALPVDNFSVRWTKTQTFGAGTYTFALGSDDGGRLFVDGVLVLNPWADQSYPTPQPSVTMALTGGSHTIVVEYYERTGYAQATFVITAVGNGVTAVPSLTGDQQYTGTEFIQLSNSSVVTAMTVTIKVVKSSGMSYNNQWTNLWNNTFTMSNSASGGFITYTFTLNPNQTMVVGSWQMAAQWQGKNNPPIHPTSGDTWTVTTTTSGGTQTLTGTY